jgi:hypothetical protein
MTEKPQSEQSLDSRLDEALEMTFPASDPIAVDSPDPRSIHCIGALRVNRHSYLKAMRGDQRVPRFINRYHASTEDGWVSLRVTQKVPRR